MRFAYGASVQDDNIWALDLAGSTPRQIIGSTRREAREAAREWYEQYGTPVVDQAKQIGKQVRDVAVEQYNTQAPKAREAVNKVVPQARERLNAILPGQRGSEDLSAVIPGSNGTVEGMMGEGE